MNKDAEFGYAIGTAWKVKPPTYAESLGSDFPVKKLTEALAGAWAESVDKEIMAHYREPVDLVPEEAVELVDGMF